VGLRVLGIGNGARRDDGVGVWVAQALAARLGDSLDVRVLGDDGFQLVDALGGIEAALLIDAVQSGAPPGTVHQIIDLLQLESVREEPVEVMPLGLQKRVELARALAAEPRFLVLDEPMAGMNQEEKEYMVRFILDAHESLGLTILLIEHHLDVVTALCDRVVVLNNGQVIAQGVPGETMNDPAVIAAYIGKVNDAA
jgi:hydrogenase maturation protease